MGFSTGVGGASAQNVPYTRGSLYFADVDAQIRAASGGRRKLDDILLSLFARIKGGERVDQNVWVAELTKEIGPSARAEFDSVIVRGKTIVPSSNAFGPCFERRPATLSAAGQTLEGFEWVRVGSVLESRCREW
jgi:predicted metalloprotease with PDZ domain